MPFPLRLIRLRLKFIKLLLRTGRRKACARDSDQNIYGSLAVTYCNAGGKGSTHPFHIKIDRKNPVNAFDSYNFSIILSELDTVSDLSNYLEEKLRAITRFDSLSYCGEEDLLGHYLLNYDNEEKKHIIGTKRNDVNSVMVGEGEWHDFIETDLYKNTKNEDRISYLWDELIQRTCQNALNGTLEGNSDLLRE